MSNYAIVVNDLSKKYKIQHEVKDPYKKLSDSIVRKLLSMFSFRRIKKENEMFDALDGINLSIKKGEKVAIIGHNGAGKSTLLKVLSRITEPTNGEVLISGRVASLLEVGTGFHPELTGRENIFLNGAVLGMTKKEIQEKFNDIVEFSGCEKFLDTPVKRYSSGMRVRLGFAVAAHLESEILIVDEVLAVGDAEFQKKCLGKMNDISNGEGRTIIFVSHNMSAVQELCDKAIYLESGKVAQIGNVSEVVSSYLQADNSYYEISRSKNVLEYSTDGHFNTNKAMVMLSINMELLVDDVFFDYAIYNEKGIKIYHYRMDRNKKLLTLHKGWNKINLELQCGKLSQGNYYAKVMLSDRLKKNVLLHLGDVLFFSIDGINKDDNIITLDSKVWCENYA